MVSKAKPRRLAFFVFGGLLNARGVHLVFLERFSGTKAKERCAGIAADGANWNESEDAKLFEERMNTEFKENTESTESGKPLWLVPCACGPGDPEGSLEES